MSVQFNGGSHWLGLFMKLIRFVFMELNPYHIIFQQTFYPGGRCGVHYLGTLSFSLSHCISFENQLSAAFNNQGPVSLRLMTSQFKDIVTHTQKMKIVKCTFCGVWLHNFVWNFKGALWNFTQNFEPIRRKMCILRGVRNLTTYDMLELWHLKS